MAATWTKKATSSGGSEAPPAGKHKAVVVAVLDLGTHSEVFAGQKPRDMRKLYIVWELVEEFLAGTKRTHTLGREFTFSLGSKSKLREFIGEWRGKKIPDGEDYDVSRLLGKSCYLKVIHETSGDRTFARVSSADLPARGEAPFKPSYTPIAWSVDDENSDPPNEPWFPFIYGRSVRDTALASRERGGGTIPENGDNRAAGTVASHAKLNEPPFNEFDPPADGEQEDEDMDRF